MQEMGRGHRSLRTGEKEGKMPASASFLPFSLNSPQGKCVKVRFLLGRTPCVVSCWEELLVLWQGGGAPG